MKNLYYLRHGESETNVTGVAAGRLDAPLTKTGREQADKAGKEAKKAGIRFDAILSSPLSRAHDTAKAVAHHTKYDESLIEITEDLIERDFGDLQGKRFYEDFGISGEDYGKDERIIDDVPNVESLESLYTRAQKLLSYVKQRPEETILLVAHGAFGGALMRALKEQPFYGQADPIDNAKLIKLI